MSSSDLIKIGHRNTEAILPKAKRFQGKPLPSLPSSWNVGYEWCDGSCRCYGQFPFLKQRSPSLLADDFL